MSKKWSLATQPYLNSNIRIGNRVIGAGKPCFIVAEMSANHLQDYTIAKKIIKAATKAGADAVKLQTYTPDTETLNSNNKWFFVRGKNNPESWKNKNLYELYNGAYMPWDWQPKLKKLANSLGLQLFSTSVDITGIDFLEEMGVPCYKVSSYDLINDYLLKRIAKTGKPIILSSGYAAIEEIEHALEILKSNGGKEIALLHCVTGYSNKPSARDINLHTIRDINERFGIVAGFSDNNSGIDFPVMSVLAGASIVEKHFILEHTEKSPDDRFSILPSEFAEMVKRIRFVEKALGKINYGPVSAIEHLNRHLRPSLFASRDIERGETLSSDNVCIVRPAAGISPRYFEDVLGKKAKKDIKFATPIRWSNISEG